MCGIAGLQVFDTSVPLDEVGEKMTGALQHRGPDSHGHWSCQQSRVFLGHTRLAIIDLSSAGAQPMHSKCGRYVLTFNGELYNHLDIRADLELSGSSISWTGGSDTETLLEAISAWGVVKALESFSGMFAFALWDKERSQMTLARDRMGEKPLYYGWVGSSFVFASELKSILQHPHFKGDIDRQALKEFIATSAVPAPLCIYKGLKKLPPASLISVDTHGEFPTPTMYWQIEELSKRSSSEITTPEQVNIWLDQIDKQLTASVEQQMASDVPLGAFLSGGYDSSLVVAKMQSASKEKIKTFSIGFDDPNLNEAHYAKSVAEYLGTEHTELYVTANDALELIPSLPDIWDEPFADPSQIPTVMVAALTKRAVTVGLSGDGGDELFGGYTRYAETQALWSKISRVPLVVRSIIRKSIVPVLTKLNLSLSNKQYTRAGSLVAKVEKFTRRLYLLSSRSREDLYKKLMMHHSDCLQLVRGGASLTDSQTDSNDFLSHMLLTDMQGYLPDTILAKVDRAAMSVSLETRAPLLDHKLVELSWLTPNDLKIRDGQGKWCLKEVLHRYLPKSIMDRPKKGFGIPLAAWLRGPLKDWAENLLSEERLEAEDYFDKDIVRSLWVSHQAGHWQHERVLWNILMFQSWQDSLKQHKANENGC